MTQHTRSDLERALRAIAETERHADAPPRLADAVMAAWDRERARRAPPASGRWRRVTAAAAGLIIAATGGAAYLSRTSTVIPPAPGSPLASTAGLTTPRTVNAAPPRVEATAIPPGVINTTPTAVPDGDVILVGEPFDGSDPVRILRVRVAAAALQSLGIQLSQPLSSDSVDIDLLVGEDGVARGARLVL